MKTWHIVDSIFTTQSLVQHQIDSFNNFVRFGIQKVVDEFKTLQIKECTITFEKIIQSRKVNLDPIAKKN